MVQTEPEYRVGFIIPKPVPWLGGANYFRNLFAAIAASQKPSLRVILFMGLLSDDCGLGNYAQVVRSPLLDRYSIPWFLNKVTATFGWQPLLFRLLKRHQVDLISHHDALWPRCPIPALPWIPDFQHIHLPNLFPKRDLGIRDRAYLRMCKRSGRVLLSSEAARMDLALFLGGRLPNLETYILRFVAALDPTAVDQVRLDYLIQRHDLPSRWFYLPNQFWAHKNHRVVVEALRKVNSIEPSDKIVVVATGTGQDYRDPSHFPALMDFIQREGLERQFRYLGLVPYPEMLCLMRHSVAVINPSLFEGWSTTVEEAKALGKLLIISNLDVHREQAPRRVTYFDPDNVEQLANILLDCWQNYSIRDEDAAYAKAVDELGAKKEGFAKQYEQIVFEICGALNHSASTGQMPK